MKTTFDEIISVVLHHEGGYVNDPKDPGGETNYGISKRAYPDVDIKNLTEGSIDSLITSFSIFLTKNNGCIINSIGQRIVIFEQFLVGLSCCGCIKSRPNDLSGDTKIAAHFCDKGIEPTCSISCCVGNSLLMGFAGIECFVNGFDIIIK